MAASIYNAQFALRLCEDHDKKELHAYCKTCNKKICSSCIKEEHHQHDWEMITDILREKKHSLPEECKEIRAKQLPSLKRELCRFDKKIEEEDARFEQNKTTLNDSRQSYINKINQLFDGRIDECRQKSKSAKQIYKDKREVLKQKVEHLETMTTALDKDINTLPDHDILDMEKEMRDELEKALSYNAYMYTCATIFVPGHIEVQILENMIGEILDVSVEEKNDIDRYTKYISSLKSASDTNAWVKVHEDRYAKLIDITGDELKTMRNACTEMIISKNGELVLADFNERKILVLTKDEDEITTIDTKPLCPSFIGKTENDNILVTLKDDGELFNLNPTSRRFVQRMTLTGKVLHTYEFREDGKTRLFTLPTRTAENKNTDICVVNRLSYGSGELVVLHGNGLLKFTYNGGGLKYDKFSPRDVDCDDKCHILFTEQFNRGVHMLSSEGLYLCKLCQYEQLHPFVISIHGDTLWCGFKEGRLNVFKYTN
ncbi:hypothetical protein FSP39_023821 [Pinctada imbricata]|uniref:B box-type domain-containing protein n=1 Tax=Pinctada imbricata TaxID=66713 RepID=A0AA88YFL0_PINIB|nr:hypothetical protein FSP39_023821 [Pinctada imbricata]